MLTKHYRDNIVYRDNFNTANFFHYHTALVGSAMKLYGFLKYVLEKHLYKIRMQKTDCNSIGTILTMLYRAITTQFGVVRLKAKCS